jgi:hypothetical protein
MTTDHEPAHHRVLDMSPSDFLAELEAERAKHGPDPTDARKHPDCLCGEISTDCVAARALDGMIAGVKAMVKLIEMNQAAAAEEVPGWHKPYLAAAYGDRALKAIQAAYRGNE